MCQIYLTFDEMYDILLSNIIDRSDDVGNESMKKRRSDLGLSQGELAKRVGVSRQTINMIENGGYNPTVELCIRICKELGVTLNDLFWRDDDV